MATHAKGPKSNGGKRPYNRRQPSPVVVTQMPPQSTHELREAIRLRQEAMQQHEDEAVARRREHEEAIDQMTATFEEMTLRERRDNLPSLAQNLLDTLLSAKEQVDQILSVAPELVKDKTLKAGPYGLVALFNSNVKVSEAIVASVSKHERSEGSQPTNAEQRVESITGLL